MLWLPNQSSIVRFLVHRTSVILVCCMYALIQQIAFAEPSKSDEMRKYLTVNGEPVSCPGVRPFSLSRIDAIASSNHFEKMIGNYAMVRERAVTDPSIDTQKLDELIIINTWRKSYWQVYSGLAMGNIGKLESELNGLLSLKYHPSNARELLKLIFYASYYFKLPQSIQIPVISELLETAEQNRFVRPLIVGVHGWSLPEPGSVDLELEQYRVMQYAMEGNLDPIRKSFELLPDGSRGDAVRIRSLEVLGTQSLSDAERIDAAQQLHAISFEYIDKPLCTHISVEALVAQAKVLQNIVDYEKTILGKLTYLQEGTSILIFATRYATLMDNPNQWKQIHFLLADLMSQKASYTEDPIQRSIIQLRAKRALELAVRN